MELLDNLLLGLQVAMTWHNLLYCAIGVALGTLIGVLPGIGPTATVAMLLPMTFGLEPTSALIMLAGIYYGSQYGGSTTAILVNLPGEASSVITCIDGYQMARRGKAGTALGLSAIGSFVAGTIATMVIAVLSPSLTKLALQFTPADYFSLMLLGLVGVVVLARGPLLNAFAMTLIGLTIGLVGTDINSGAQRFTFGYAPLADGVDFVVVAMGVFAFTEILANLESTTKREVFTSKIKNLLPSRSELRQATGPILRGTVIGSVLGVLPGGGTLLSSFASYALEKKIAKDPSRFGHGALEGVAGPESANNAGAQTSFIPMLTLGIPSTPVMALMIGALMIQGITPGPQVIDTRPDLFWGIIASMWIGNAMLLVLNLPMIGIWVRLLSIPYRLLYPAIVLFCCVGVYALNNSTFDVMLAAGFGVAGYIFYKLDCEPAPLLLGCVLGPMMEENLRRGMLLSRGDATIFFTSPLSVSFLLAAALLLALVLMPAIRKTREEAFTE